MTLKSRPKESVSSEVIPPAVSLNDLTGPALTLGIYANHDRYSLTGIYAAINNAATQTPSLFKNDPFNMSNPYASTPITSVREFLDYIQKFQTYAPTDCLQGWQIGNFKIDYSSELQVLNVILNYYANVDQITKQLNDPSSSEALQFMKEWVMSFAQFWGTYLDNTDSIGPETLKSIYAESNANTFYMQEYFKGPSGWKTWNQFFAREIKPGARPVTPNVKYSTAPVVSSYDLVSPGDCTPKHYYNIEKGSASSPIVDAPSFSVTVKGQTKDLNIGTLIQEVAGDEVYDAFNTNGGTFMHAFLNISNYHRYHVPVSGHVISQGVIPGQAALPGPYDPKAGAQPSDPTGWQWDEERGFIIMKPTVNPNDPTSETIEGTYVVVMPIGMAQVSSVNITPIEQSDNVVTPKQEKGTYLRQGEEFGYFAFGGSDIIVLVSNPPKSEGQPTAPWKFTPNLTLWQANTQNTPPTPPNTPALTPMGGSVCVNSDLASKQSQAISPNWGTFTKN